MANLRFPSNSLGDNKPFMLFSTHRAQYNNIGTGINTVPTSNSVALYFPAGYTVNDNLNYQMESTGLIGATFDAMTQGGSGSGITANDVKNVIEGVLTNKESAGKVGGAAAGVATSVVKSAGAASVLGAALSAGGIFGNVAAERSKKSQIALNPREFMIFKSPSIRTFAFVFTFIPSNEREVQDVPEIIKFFRRASYPTLTNASTTYNFPEAFNINIGNSDKIIKIPEVVCTTVSVTYNSNSMSYFEIDNLPVEITLNLNFQELQPINKSLVDRGY